MVGAATEESGGQAGYARTPNELGSTTTARPPRAERIPKSGSAGGRDKIEYLTSIENAPCGGGDGLTAATAAAAASERVRGCWLLVWAPPWRRQTRERQLERGKHQVLFSSGGYMGRAGLSAIRHKDSFFLFILYHTAPKDVNG